MTNQTEAVGKSPQKSAPFPAKYWRLAVCFLVPVAILMIPVPQGLTLPAWQLFAVYVGAILGFILRPLPEAALLLCVISISGLAFNNTKVVLSGFASTTAWLVFSAFMIGTAFIKTGLGRRIAYWLLGKVGGTTRALGYVAALSDLALSPATPSNTARTGGIIYPIIRSIAESLGSTPGETGRKVGSYLTVLCYSLSLTTGYVFLTAIAPNFLMVNFGQNILKVDITWALWFKAAAVPGLLCLFVIPLIVYWVYPPELKTFDNKAIAEKGMVDLGPVTRGEKLLALFFVLAIIAWATGSWTKINSTSVAIGLVSACLLFGVVKWDDLLDNRGAWSTFVWYAAIIGIADGLAKAKFFVWLAKVLGDALPIAGHSVLLVMIALLVFNIVLHYAFASLAVFCAAMLPVIFTLALVAGAPIYPTFFLMAFATDYGASVTHYGGALGPVLFGTGYVDQKTWWKVGAITTGTSMVIHVVVGLPYWKLIGLW